jgi:hypothetical protein
MFQLYLIMHSAWEIIYGSIDGVIHRQLYSPMFVLTLTIARGRGRFVPHDNGRLLSEAEV